MKAHSRGHSVLWAAVGGSTIFASAIAALFFFARDTGSHTSDRYQTGTIQFTSSSTCQRLVIDNNTFMIKPGQQLPCGDTQKYAPKKDAPKEAARSTMEASPRYSSGGRVDAIRDSFNNR